MDSKIQFFGGTINSIRSKLDFNLRPKIIHLAANNIKQR